MSETPPVEIRKQVVIVEDIFHEGGPVARKPLKRGAILSVIKNPFAGRYEENIANYVKVLEPLGLDMAKRLVAALGGDAQAIEGYGKGAIVGGAGEMEHGALWHPPGGYSMRAVLGEAKAIVPSASKVGAVGARLDVPIGHVNAAYVRSHFDAMEVGIPDAPRADEIVFILAIVCCSLGIVGRSRVEAGMSGAGWPPGSGRRQLDRLAIGLAPAVIWVGCLLPLHAC